MKPDRLVIAFTCTGRRVQLVRHFRRACARLGVEPFLLGLDSQPALAPATYYCDQSLTVPAGGEKGFSEAVLDIVQQRRVDLLVPLADPDLVPLAAIRPQLVQAGCLPAFGTMRTTDISRDKLRTCRFFSEIGLATPRTCLLPEAMADSRQPLPAFVKPRGGSAGKHAFAVEAWDMLPGWITARGDDFVVQELLDGQEVTVDVFIAPDGRPRCAVPRLRIEVRGGEVTKSQVRLDPEVMRQAEQIAAALPDAFGVINIQGFIRSDGTIGWTEINPRFGGGSPLSIEAGADLPAWLVSLALGRQPDYDVPIRDGMTMLRFDDAVYLNGHGTIDYGTDAATAGSLRQPTAADNASIQTAADEPSAAVCSPASQPPEAKS